MKIPKTVKWILPETVIGLGISKDNLDEPYRKAAKKLQQQIDQVSDTDTSLSAFQSWSRACEVAMDASLQVQHVLDPIRAPYTKLPTKSKGRCLMITKEVSFDRKRIAEDRFAHFDPQYEVFSAISVAKCKQTRRLKSFQVALRSFDRKKQTMENSQLQSIRRQLHSEWSRIRGAKGYGRAWWRWMLSFQEVNMMPQSIPSIEDVALFVQITEFDAKACIAQEHKSRKNSFKCAIQTDFADAFGSLTYKCVKQQDHLMLQDVPLCRRSPAKLCRSPKGRQTIDRAELYALIQLLLHVVEGCSGVHIHVYTDSTYVMNLLSRVREGLHATRLHQYANSDLILQLADMIDTVEIQLHKVKSHQDLRQIPNKRQLWEALGNEEADRVATRALNSIPHEMRFTLDQAVKHDTQEMQDLHNVMVYMAEVNLQRHLMLQEIAPKPTRMTRPVELQQDEDPYVAFNFSGGRSFAPSEVEPEILTANLQGSHLAYAFWKWWETILWPEVSDDGSLQIDTEMSGIADQGISWVELTINFILSTGFFLPIRVSGSGEKSIFRQYCDHEIQMLPNSMRTAAKQSVSAQDMFKCLQNLTQQTWLPDFVTAKSVSLQRLGYGGITKGLTPRPQIPNAAATMNFVRQYLQDLEGSAQLSKTFDKLQPLHILEVPSWLDEPSAYDRFLAYQKLTKRHRRRKQRDLG
eukprot:Skav206824  [mRNA]  locus=scaffold3672:41448:45922:+ [translate_table: standard]